MSKDFYPPQNRIVLLSTKSITTSTSPIKDPDMEIDLNGDGLPDLMEEQDFSEDVILTDDEKEEVPPAGMAYDKAGNLVLNESSEE